ncbi:MAG TPA: zf-HC2 domain-containing protein [Propionibacteriaceae bacterium]|nr:zf-HC2 domain-containing protein [Propionibacteriaceae bacterium]
MRKAPCAELAELRSAFVDGALTNTDRERLLSHLVDCSDCRHDIEDLRAVRELLNRTKTQPSPTPADLSVRLVSIAGPASVAPLWTRPFRRTQPTGGGKTGGLPSHRRTVKLRVITAATAVAATITAMGVVGYAAAPSLPTIGDPISEAQAAFSSTRGQFPLANDALTAVMLADSTGLSANVPPSLDGPTVPTGPTMIAAEAKETMQRAADAASSVSYSGRQSFVAYRSGGPIAAQVDVEARAGQGSQVMVVNQTGRQLLKGFKPALISSRVVDDELLDLLERNYRLAGTRGSTVAGRSAAVVAAIGVGSSTTAARWWVDDATGIVLWQETYDKNGSVDLSFGFTSVAVSRENGILEHLPPRLAVPRTNTSLTLSSATELSVSGWSCPRKLAGLSLVRLRTDRPGNPETVQLVYSDGLAAVSVFEQRGRLTAAPQGSQWDATLGAYVRRGASGVATWQSGDVVFTAVTDGNSGVLADAVAALPHDGAEAPTTLGRIKAGWARILADVKG